MACTSGTGRSTSTSPASASDAAASPSSLRRLAATFALALVSYKFVELPIRKGKTWSIRAVSISGVIAACVAGVLLISGLGSTAVPGLGGPGTPLAHQVVIVPDTVPPTAPPDHVLPLGPNAPPPTPPNRDVRVTIVGDSVGFSLVRGAPRIIGMSLSGSGQLGCGAMAGDYWVGNKFFAPDMTGNHCKHWADGWRSVAATDPDVVLVTLGSWEIYDHQIGGARLNVGAKAYRHALLASLDQDLALLNVRKKARVAMFNVPCFAASNAVFDAPRTDARRTRWVNGVFDEFAQRHRDQVQIIDLNGFVCRKGQPVKKMSGIELRPDGTHFSVDSNRLVWRWLAPQLLDFARHAAA